MHTVIVGGGLTGVKVALELSKKSLGKITLMTDERYLLDPAMFSRVLAGCKVAGSTVTLEDIFATHQNVHIVLDHMESIDLSSKRVAGKNIAISYDTLIIAIGSTSDYFTVSELEPHSFGTSTLDQAHAFNRVVHNSVAGQNHKDATYVIVGAGLAGVEIAGSLGGYVRNLTKAHSVGASRTHIILVEKEHRILPQLSTTASKKVGAQLNRMGVTVITDHEARMMFTRNYLTIGSKRVPKDAIIWARGSSTNPFFARHPHEFARTADGRVVVNHYLEACDSVYVLGDNTSTPFADRTEIALGQAVFVARHLKRKATGRRLRQYRSHPVAVGVSVGKRWAYTEKYSIYSAGRVGYWLYSLGNYLRVRSLLSRNQALRLLHVGTTFNGDCDLCGT
jgi:NADH dehydrogenase